MCYVLRLHLLPKRKTTSASHIFRLFAMAQTSRLITRIRYYSFNLPGAQDSIRQAYTGNNLLYNASHSCLRHRLRRYRFLPVLLSRTCHGLWVNKVHRPCQYQCHVSADVEYQIHKVAQEMGNTYSLYKYLLNCGLIILCRSPKVCLVT